MPSNPGQLLSRWHARVRPRTPRLDGHGRDVLAEIRQIGLDHIEAVRSSRVYFLEGDLSDSHVRLIAEELLADPVAESFEVAEGFSRREDSHPAVEVHRQPGVMDPVALSTLDAAQRTLAAAGASGSPVTAVQTARRYEIIGAKDVADLERIAAKVLANGCIETCYIDGFGRSDRLPEEFPVPPRHKFQRREVALRLLDDAALKRLSREGHLFLSLEEMRAVRDHFAGLGREPSDLELETLAQTWSEHCVHKTLKSAFVYRGDDFGRDGTVEKRFDNLLKDTIVAATAKLDRDWCLSVFVDNAGIIGFDDRYGLAFKVETHNHPSAIEPYGGAATGIGGCIRDIMGCGLGAKPIASTDVFCVAPPDYDESRLPKDVLHPRRVLRGVVGGVRDYGNRMGIPTVNGAIYFDDRYVANPLVFCGSVGLIPRDRIAKAARPGDRIVVAGGRTGRDGIHGATFSSAELTDTHADEFAHAVQIGHAIEEKKVLDAMLLARDHADGCLYSAVTDCGAGGLSSAVGEMGEKLGARVDLDDVPLKYAGLRYDEIWISEAQERMVFAVDPSRLDKFLALFAEEEVEATVIGTFTDDRVLCVRYHDETVAELDMRFLHEGYPRTTLEASWTAKTPETIHSVHGKTPPCETPAGRDATGRLRSALSSLNTASKEWVIRQYDHEVQGRSVIKPLVGPGAGPSDAAVLRPVYESTRGVAVACGLCPELGDVDPYWMAIAAVDEAIRNAICVGVNPLHTAILDNYCWPKVDNAESLGALVRASVGAYDAAVAYGLPFVSGKDSLNNEFTMSAEEATRTGLPEHVAIPYTLLISAMGVVDDVRACVSVDLKEPGNRLVVASAPALPDRMFAGESQACEPQGQSDIDGDGNSKEPARRLSDAYDLHRKVFGLIRSGKVRAAHDVSDGGLAVAVAEMCIASNLGATVEITQQAYRHSIFAPVPTTYVLEMSEKNAVESGLPVIGRVEKEPSLRVRTSLDGPLAIDAPVSELAEAWRTPLSNGGGR